MSRPILGFLVVSCLLSTPGAAQQTVTPLDKKPAGAEASKPVEVVVTVFRDADGDGARAIDEPPIAKVVVSDQVTVARTGDDGCARFRCEAWRTRFVYASIPEDCSLASRASARIPYPAAGSEGAAPLEIAIGLVPLSASECMLRDDESWTFVQTSDIHVARADEAETYKLDLSEVAALSPRPVFVAATGDLTNTGNNAGEFQNYLKGLEGFALPHFDVIGNHDVDKTPARVTNFEQHLGPRNRSWNVPGFRGIAVDSVHYDAGQEAWLLAELASLEPGRRALIFQHYLPTEAFLETLAKFPVAAVFSGHWHGQRLRRFGDILDCNTSTFRFGGIDRSPRGFRIITVHKDGRLTTEFREGGIHRHFEIVAPAEGDASLGGRVALVVAARDTSDPATGVATLVDRGVAGHAHAHGDGSHHHEHSHAPPGAGSPSGATPAQHAEELHGRDAEQVHLEAQGSWLWVGSYETKSSRAPQRVTAIGADRNLRSRDVQVRDVRLRDQAKITDDGASFPQHRGSASKRGAVAAATSFRDGFQLRWTARAGPGNLASAVVDAGRVVVACPAESIPEDAGLACFDAATGDLLWRSPTQSSVVHAPAIAGDRVVAISQTGFVRAFTLEDGKALFAIRVGKPNLRWDNAAPLVDGRTAWVGVGQGFAAIDLDAGKVLWSYGDEPKPPKFWSASDWWPNTYGSPALSGRFLATGQRAGLFVMEPATGAILWSVESKNVIAAFDDDGTLWALADRKLRSWRRANEDGSEWTPQVAGTDDLGDTTTAPAIGADRVVVVTGSGSVRAYAKDDARLLWSRQLPPGLTSQRPYARGEAQVTGSPLIVGDEVVFGATDGVLRALSLADGRELAARSLGVPVTGSPAFAGGVLYITTWDGNVFAFAPAPPAVPLVIAHRGGALEAPENTMAAFRHALELGVDWIEIDVHLAADGVPVVIHDATVDRTAGTKGARKVSALSATELGAVDVGAAFHERFRGEGVPTLRQVLELPLGPTRVMVELKRPAPGGQAPLSADDIRLAGAAVTAVRNAHAESQVAFASFSPLLLAEAAKLLPQVPRIGIAGNEDELAAHLDLHASAPLATMAVELKLLSAALRDDLRRRGITIWAWTLRKPEDLDAVRRNGVDGLITDAPSSLR